MGGWPHLEQSFYSCKVSWSWWTKNADPVRNSTISCWPIRFQLCEDASPEPLLWPYRPARQPFKSKLWTPRKCNGWSLTSIPTIQWLWSCLLQFANVSPNGGFSVSWAETKLCKERLWHWYATNQTDYHVNYATPTTRNLDSWWLGGVVYNAKRGATESHCFVLQENCQLDRLCRSRSVFQLSQWCKLHSVQCSSSSADVLSM